MTVGAWALVVSLALAGCDSRADEPLATPVADRTPVSANTDAIEIRDGDCINSTMAEGVSTESALVVPCGEAWQYRVLNSFDVADYDFYPGGYVFQQRAYESCDRRYSQILFPNDESWYLGYRTVNCLQDSFGLTSGDPGKLDRLVDFTLLSFGECFNEAPETGDLMVELVDCSGDWELRVLNSFDFAESYRYPGEYVFEELAHENCDRQYGVFRYPDRESWESGGRTITCLQKN